MGRHWISLFVLPAVLTAAAAILPIEASTAPAAPPPALVVAGDADRVAWVEESVSLFAEVGLQLPPTRVSFFDDKAHCRGHEGYFLPHDDVATITICSELAFVLVHELAHAWIWTHVDADTRSAYLALRGLETWADRSDDWADRGTEDAAFVMQQVLMRLPASPDSEDWQSRRAAFALLTGFDPMT